MVPKRLGILEAGGLIVHAVIAAKLLLKMLGNILSTQPDLSVVDQTLTLKLFNGVYRRKIPGELHVKKKRSGPRTEPCGTPVGTCPCRIEGSPREIPSLGSSSNRRTGPNFWIDSDLISCFNPFQSFL